MYTCPVCSTESVLFLKIPFAPFSSKSTDLENFEVEYFKCPHCGVIYCPEMFNWPPQKYSKLVYNEGYYSYDHDLIDQNGNRQKLCYDFIKNNITAKTNLDYGGGFGFLSDILNKNGYQSVCYDPFTKFNDRKVLETKYDFVSCIEVLEHSYNIMDVINDLEKAAKDTIYISTGFSDNVNNFKNWYYLNPRVGHILIFTKKAIEILFNKIGFQISTITHQNGDQYNVLLTRRGNKMSKKKVSSVDCDFSDIKAGLNNIQSAVSLMKNTLNPEELFTIYPNELNLDDPAKTTTHIVNHARQAFPYGKIPLLPVAKFADDIAIDFNNGARTYIPDTAKGDYRVRFMSVDRALCMFDTHVPAGHVATSSKRFFIDYLIEVYKDNNPTPIIKYRMDLKDKLVLIQCHGGGMGDSIAWFSYIDRFIKKHQCRALVTLNPDIIPLFKNTYPYIKFITKDDTVKYKPFATYYLGLFFEGDTDFQPTDFRLAGLHKTAANILGVDPAEEPPRVDLSAPRQIKEKYVVISAQSTTRCKFWNNPHGWINVIKFLKSAGYRVLCIDRDVIVGNSVNYSTIPFGSEDFTGNLPLQERVNLIKDADFFIGLSSGLSWLAWCCKVPVVMISGFTEPTNEFYTPYRIFNPLVCHGCWNDMRENFDHADYDYCPKLRHKPEQFICTSSISPEYVINTIKTIPTFKEN